MKKREQITHVPVSLSKPIMGPSQREASAAEKKGKNKYMVRNSHSSIAKCKKNHLIALLETSY